jgi:prevent-host-death family protein
MVVKMAVSEFRAKCTRVLREVAARGDTIEVTRRGRVIAVVSRPAPSAAPDPSQFFGSLKGTVLYLGDDFDEPLGDEECSADQPNARRVGP